MVMVNSERDKGYIEHPPLLGIVRANVIKKHGLPVKMKVQVDMFHLLAQP